MLTFKILYAKILCCRKDFDVMNNIFTDIFEIPGDISEIINICEKSASILKKLLITLKTI